MTPAHSVTIVRSELEDFLYASIGAASNDMPISVLSTFARLNLDPWKQAAALRDMPRSSATRRLAELIAQLPGERATADLAATAQRLIELLPQGTTPKASLYATSGPAERLSVPFSKVVLYALLAFLGTAAILMIAADREPPLQDRYDQGPPARSPPQTNQ